MFYRVLKNLHKTYHLVLSENLQVQTGPKKKEKKKIRAKHHSVLKLRDNRKQEFLA